MKVLGHGTLPARYSNTYFMKADRDAMVGPLQEVLSEKEPAKYASLTALEYHQQRIATAYLL
jgi:isopenicillin N synthase-like dioxygenase